MTRKTRDETLTQIEATQAALRDCIEQAKELVEDSERLVRRHREKPDEAKPRKTAR